MPTLETFKTVLQFSLHLDVIFYTNTFLLTVTGSTVNWKKWTILWHIEIEVKEHWLTTLFECIIANIIFTLKHENRNTLKTTKILKKYPQSEICTVFRITHTEQH